jgi:hypothetical protein
VAVLRRSVEISTVGRRNRVSSEPCAVSRTKTIDRPSRENDGVKTPPVEVSLVVVRGSFSSEMKRSRSVSTHAKAELNMTVRPDVEPPSAPPSAPASVEGSEVPQAQSSARPAMSHGRRR